MYCDLTLLESYIHDHVDQLRHEAENDRLVHLAIGPGRPIRRRIADLLVAAAEYVSDQPLTAPTQARTQMG
jgi:hypothetical protein